MDKLIVLGWPDKYIVISPNNPDNFLDNIYRVLPSIGLVSTGTLFAQEEEEHNYIPENGYVPDEETAIKIAVAVWIPIYGEEQIEKEKPYVAILKDNIWYVTGSLPKGWLGGVAIAEIDKKTGKILRISHGK